MRGLEYCRSMGVPHFVFASSSGVYGPDSPLLFRRRPFPVRLAPGLLAGHRKATLISIHFMECPGAGGRRPLDIR